MNNNNAGVTLFTLGYDVTISEKLGASANLGYAMNSKKNTTRDNSIGTELNAQLDYKMFPNLTTSLTAAYVILGDFYKHIPWISLGVIGLRAGLRYRAGVDKAENMKQMRPPQQEQQYYQPMMQPEHQYQPQPMMQPPQMQPAPYQLYPQTQTQTPTTTTITTTRPTTSDQSFSFPSNNSSFFNNLDGFSSSQQPIRKGGSWNKKK
jgi:hypothetical protein